jgi:hypothetical protein
LEKKNAISTINTLSSSYEPLTKQEIQSCKSILKLDITKTRLEILKSLFIQLVKHEIINDLAEDKNLEKTVALVKKNNF